MQERPRLADDISKTIRLLATAQRATAQGLPRTWRPAAERLRTACIWHLQRLDHAKAEGTYFPVPDWTAIDGALDALVADSDAHTDPRRGDDARNLLAAQVCTHLLNLGDLMGAVDDHTRNQQREPAHA